MGLGVVIDSGSCIGCHACSTACKSENEVPVGVYRTWVTTVETGRFPNTRRSFQVTRCNHCSNAPCVRICPTGAMHTRSDGIVDFADDACIGCKSCLQACPYDAIYIDPDNHTAAKCNFCAHRIDIGLEPACVVVCPEHAIITGDLSDPHSEISRVVAKNNVVVRKPEKGTAPNAFYIEGNEVTLSPTALERTPVSFMWGESRPLHHGGSELVPAQGPPGDGPVSLAPQRVHVGYNAQHRIQWHWPIPAYIVTKYVSGSVFCILAITAMVPELPFVPAAMVYGGGLAILCLVLTLVLLLYDLDRSDRFLYLLTRPQRRSWVARAAWLLTAFSAVAVAWWSLELAGFLGLLEVPLLLRLIGAGLAAPLGAMTAIYTGFLFAQAEGRDLWQSPHVPLQQSLHGMMLGFGALSSLSFFIKLPALFAALISNGFVAALFAGLLATLLADFTIPHSTEVARLASRDMTRGHYRRWYWAGGIAIGHVLPLSLLALQDPAATFMAFGFACIGLFAYNLAFVMAPQRVPNS